MNMYQNVVRIVQYGSRKPVFMGRGKPPIQLQVNVSIASESGFQNREIKTLHLGIEWVSKPINTMRPTKYYPTKKKLSVQHVIINLQYGYSSQLTHSLSLGSTLVQSRYDY